MIIEEEVKPRVVSPEAARRMLGNIRLNSVYALLNAGLLASFKNDETKLQSRRWILVSSIDDYLENRAAAAKRPCEMKA